MDHPQRPVFALALRIAGAASFATMFLLIKFAGYKGVSLLEIMFWRQAVPVMIVLAWLVPIGGMGRLKTARSGSHARRAVVGMIGMVCNFGGVLLLPLAESTTLSFSAPLFAVILTAVWLRDRVGPWRWTAVLAGFAGVVIIANPGHALVSPLGAALSLSAAFLTTVINFLIRDLGRSEEPVTTVFYFSAFGTVITALMLPFVMTAHDTAQWLLLIGIGATGFSGQMFLTGSLRYGAVTSVIVMDYTQLIWATLFGWLVWQQLPSSATWLGAPLIIAAGITIAWREHHLARRKAQLSAAGMD